VKVFCFFEVNFRVFFGIEVWLFEFLDGKLQVIIIEFFDEIPENGIAKIGAFFKQQLRS
jgi:hypothetical protein